MGWPFGWVVKPTGFSESALVSQSNRYSTFKPTPRMAHKGRQMKF
jgi:hypothetical protein